jgi:hypothetical protein
MNSDPTIIPHPSVFISSSGSADTSILREALHKRGYTTVGFQDLAVPGKSFSEALIENIRNADLFVAVIGDDPGNKNVFYEMGFAQAYNKRVLAVSPSGLLPFAHDIAYLKVDPTNKEAIEFGLNSVLSVPKERFRVDTPTKQTHPIGHLADQLIEETHRANGPDEGFRLESVILRALQASGVTIHSEAVQSGDIGFDLAVWSDDLEPWIANPLLIQLKTKIAGGGQLLETVRQMTAYLERSGAQWGMLLCNEIKFDGVDSSLLGQIPANVLIMTTDEFLRGLKTKGFGDLAIGLRNDRTHLGR